MPDEIALKDSKPIPGHVYRIRSPKFGVETVVCVEVPHQEREFRIQFAPLGQDGICARTLYWDSVRDDIVTQTYPSLRVYLRTVDGPQPEGWAQDARGSKPVPADDEGAEDTSPLRVAADPDPVASPVPITALPPPRPLPPGCQCPPGTWPAQPFRVPLPCAVYTEEDGKCIMCEHLRECHSAAAIAAAA